MWWIYFQLFLCFFFSHWFLEWLSQFAIPQIVNKGFLQSQPLLAFVVRYFLVCHSFQCKMKSQGFFDGFRSQYFVCFKMTHYWNIFQKKMQKIELLSSIIMFIYGKNCSPPSISLLLTGLCVVSRLCRIFPIHSGKLFIIISNTVLKLHYTHMDKYNFLKNKLPRF